MFLQKKSKIKKEKTKILGDRILELKQEQPLKQEPLKIITKVKNVPQYFKSNIKDIPIQIKKEPEPIISQIKEEDKIIPIKILLPIKPIETNKIILSEYIFNDKKEKIYLNNLDTQNFLYDKELLKVISPKNNNFTYKMFKGKIIVHSTKQTVFNNILPFNTVNRLHHKL